MAVFVLKPAVTFLYKKRSVTGILQIELTPVMFNLDTVNFVTKRTTPSSTQSKTVCQKLFIRHSRLVLYLFNFVHCYDCLCSLIWWQQLNADFVLRLNADVYLIMTDDYILTAYCTSHA